MPTNTSQPNAWDNAVRISDALNGYFHGSYTVVIAENIYQLAATICTFNDDAYPGPNYFVKTFTYGTLTYTVLTMMTSNSYSGDNSTAKPSLNITDPSCLMGVNIKNIPVCTKYPVFIYNIKYGGRNYFVYSIY